MREEPALEASGLDIELRCPRCGPHAALVDMQNDAGESRCTFCAGSHVAQRGMKKVFVELGGVAWRSIESLAKTKSRPGATRCPSCHAHTAAVTVGPTNSDVCPRCVTAWFAPGTLFNVTRGKYGARTNAPVEPRMPGGLAKKNTPRPQKSATPPPRPKSKVLFLALPVLLLGSAGSVYWYLVRGGLSPLALFREEAPVPVEEKNMVALVPEPAAPGSEAAVADYPFGGRTSAAWEARLTALKARSDQRGRDLYALTKQRAAANELTVDDAGDRVTVRPSQALLAKIGARLNLAAAASIDAPLAESGAAFELKSTSFRPSKRHPRIIFAKRDTPTATLRILFRAGAYDDAHRSGLTVLAQHAILGANAAGDHAQLMLDVFAAGASLKLETGVRESAITLTAPAAEFERLAKKIAAMSLAPKITAAGFEDAKSRALTHSQDADLGSLVSAIPRTVFSEPGYQNDPEGDKETIRALTVAEVARHLAGPMSPANTTVVVAGKFDPKKLKSILSKFSGGTQRAPQRPKGELAGNYHLRSALEFHLVAFPVELKSPRSIAAAHLAGALLQERIFHQFRSSGLAYAVLAAPVHREWLDSVVLILPLDTEQTVPVGSLLNDAVEKMKTGGIEDADFERNRRFLLADFEQIDRDSERLAYELGNGGGELEWIGPKVLEELSKLTKSELADQLGEQISSKNSIHVHFSPKSGAAAEKSAYR